MAKVLAHEKCVVVDRCNVHRKERRIWINIARKAQHTNIQSLYLNTAIQVCKQRVAERRNHPTLQGPEGMKVVDQFLRGFSKPEKFEGFNVVYVCKPDEVNAALDALKRINANPKQFKGDSRYFTK